MPTGAAAVTAIYKPAPANTYTLTMVGGIGDGNYTAGQGVAITAGAAPAGQVFDRWTETAGGFADPTSSSTTFTMPAGNATVTTTYKAAGGGTDNTKYIKLWGKTTSYNLSCPC